MPARAAPYPGRRPSDTPHEAPKSESPGEEVAGAFRKSRLCRAYAGFFGVAGFAAFFAFFFTVHHRRPVA
jgi:hypothetical protein